MNIRHLFPTPAPRGGVPLDFSLRSRSSGSASFQPLRRGAVFLCPHGRNGSETKNSVSNPCAAGRCSSDANFDAIAHGDAEFPTPAPRGGVPLGEIGKILNALLHVSNPCAAGRCSSAYPELCDLKLQVTFPTPAPRGGVPLWDVYTLVPDQPAEVSNPCAAGRCSSVAGVAFTGSAGGMFPTPAPRGGVPLTFVVGAKMGRAWVSNPCAAGRCSSGKHTHQALKKHPMFPTPAPRGGVPLGRRRLRFSRAITCFQPLRRGAVFL